MKRSMMQVRTVLASWVWGACACFVGGCVDRAIVQLDGGIDDVGDDDVGDDDVGNDDVGPAPLCPQLELGSEAPVEVALSTIGELDDFVVSCQGSGSPDLAIGWTAPFDGQFIVRTVGSTFDPLLAALDGGCGGPEIACNDDLVDLEAGLQLAAVAGQTFTFVLEAFSSESGTTTLVIDPVPTAQCPDGDVSSPSPTITVVDEIAGAPDRTGSTCGGFGTPERLYTLTAPADGTYGFEVAADFNPVLYLQDGVCSFTELACNDDLPGTLWSGLGYPMTNGQTVTVGIDALDGVGGELMLLVDRIATEACPALFIGSEVPTFFEGFTFEGGLDTAGSSCGGWATLDQTMEWVAPAAGEYRIAIDEADHDWVLSVFDGKCDGPLLGCRNRWESGGAGGSVVVQLQAGQPIAIAVDGLAGSTGYFSFHIEAFEGCDAIPLPPGLPVSIVGSTAGEPAENAAGCAPTDDSPETTYVFVPPATGQVRIDTIGSSYDTVLYARAGECLGPEIGCNDDGDVDVSSELVLDVVAGQPVYVFVDGYGGDSGPYQLNLTQL